MSSGEKTAIASGSGYPGWLAGLLRPALAFRLRYLPLVMVYFAYGALGIIDVARDMWIKERLTLSPAELAGIGVWLSLPWTIKMVFGELVDSIPILGSQRKSYIIIGAAVTASGLLVLAGAAGGWLVFARPDHLYLLGALLIVIGTVIQDVVADAMSTEVVARVDDSGQARPDDDIRAELGMVQVLGRLALSFGILAVAGTAGWLAGVVDRETVFLSALLVPAISVAGVLLIGSEQAVPRSPDWRILGGGMAFGATVLAIALGGIPFGQEVIFVLSMTVIIAMLVFVTRELDERSRRAIFYTTLIIFAFRATPGVGDGYFWWTLDVLEFDEAFYGTLRQTGAILAFAALWIFSKQLTEYSVTTVLFWIAVAGAILSLPNIGLFYGLHHWTEENLRVRRAHDRGGRRRHRITVCAAQHGAVAHTDRVLRAGRASRDLVRADGFADEHGAGRRPAANPISQPGVHDRARRLCRSGRVADHRHRDQRDRSDRCHPAVRPPRVAQVMFCAVFSSSNTETAGGLPLNPSSCHLATTLS